MEVGTRDDALSMFDALAGNSYIRKVDLSLNEIDDDCLSSISLALFDNTSITHLNLANNAILSEGAECACAALCDCTLFVHMIIFLTCFSTPFASDLIGTLEENKTLEEIYLRGNHIDDSVLEEIDAILNERQGSTRVESSSSSELGATVRSLAANDPNLVELMLDGIDLGHSSEAEALIDALASNTVVTKLSFDNTDMDDSLVAALSLALVDNQTITNLSLRNNQITSEGCEYVSELSSNSISFEYISKTTQNKY